MIPSAFGAFAAQAVVPEQIPAYVTAVSDRKPVPCGSCIAYAGEDELALIGYPLHDPCDRAALEEALREALRLPAPVRGKRLTVVCAERPEGTPDTPAPEDMWWGIDLPAAPPGQKLRNTLRRAAREVRVEQSGGVFDGAHLALAEEHSARLRIAPGMRRIYSRLPDYLATSRSALLFSAYRLRDNALAACAIAEYGALRTAFYMFAFRAGDSPPGAADALLAAVLEEAEARGHAQCNLGLGMNAGVAFFKRKRRARPFLRYLEYSLQTA